MSITITVFMTNGGAPYTSYTPTISIWKVSNGSNIVSAVAMTQVSTTSIYSYNFSGFVYGTNYVYLITGDPAVNASERYKWGSVMQEVADRIIVTVQANGGNSSTTFLTDRSEATTNYWSNALCTFLTGALSGQVQKITGYNGSTYFVTFLNGFTGTPSAGDLCEFIVV